MEAYSKDLEITFEGFTLFGNLEIPDHATALVIFSHGSGSSRFSARNKFVSDQLNQHGLATLLVDLLTPEEDAVYENRFDIALLTTRLVAVTRYFLRKQHSRIEKFGYFGASTGAASAIMAASELKDKISAIVSRGGRPDLAYEGLGKVTAPTLLIVGGDDTQVLEMNEQAFAGLNCEKKLEVVPGATHLFEESGTLEQVAHLAANWFTKYLI